MAISITDTVRAYQCYTECIRKFYNTEPPPPGCVDSNGKVVIVPCPPYWFGNCYPEGCGYWNARRLAEINRCKKQCGIEDILKPISLVNGATVTSLQIETARYKSQFEKSTVIAIDRVGPPRRRYSKPIPEQCRDINDCLQRATDWYRNHPDRIRYDKCLAASKAWLDCMAGCKDDPDTCTKRCGDARDRTSPSRAECDKLIKIVQALLEEYTQLLLDCQAAFPVIPGGGVVCIVSYPYPLKHSEDMGIYSWSPQF